MFYCCPRTGNIRACPCLVSVCLTRVPRSFISSRRAVPTFRIPSRGRRHSVRFTRFEAAQRLTELNLQRDRKAIGIGRMIHTDPPLYEVRIREDGLEQMGFR